MQMRIILNLDKCFYFIYLFIVLQSTKFVKLPENEMAWSWLVPIFHGTAKTALNNNYFSPFRH